MILDQMKNAVWYTRLAPEIMTALEHMERYTPENYPGGRVDVDGNNLYLLLNTYETHSPTGAVCEAHRQYIDVMYMVEGEEIIYVKPTDQLNAITKEYDPSCDALLSETDGDATPVRLSAGAFVVLFPQDAHSPACFVDKPQTVKKIIAKVRIR